MVTTLSSTATSTAAAGACGAQRGSVGSRRRGRPGSAVRWPAVEAWASAAPGSFTVGEGATLDARGLFFRRGLRPTGAASAKVAAFGERALPRVWAAKAAGHRAGGRRWRAARGRKGGAAAARRGGRARTGADQGPGRLRRRRRGRQRRGQRRRNSPQVGGFLLRSHRPGSGDPHGLALGHREWSPASAGG